MGKKEDKRNARRIALEPPIAGALSHLPVSLVDLSTSGARVQHDAKMPFQPGKRFFLQFSCEGDQFQLTCIVARSRMEMNGSHRTIYTSGLRFVDLHESDHERLWGLIGLLAVDVLAHQAATSEECEFQIMSH
ncbi:MAG: PilZ domain-containing protein [Thermoanaerobaculia bacterium]